MAIVFDPYLGSTRRERDRVERFPPLLLGGAKAPLARLGGGGLGREQFAAADDADREDGEAAEDVARADAGH